MSDFWANRIATEAPPAPRERQEPVSPGPWWRGDTPQPPAQPQTVAPQQQATAPAPVTEDYRPQKAQHLRAEGYCPDCGSGDYFRPQGTPNAMEQCYACGYNPRFAHSTAGVGLPSESGPATPAKQVASGGLGGKSNYQPSTFIARNVGGA
jgi:hypothetical protein